MAKLHKNYEYLSGLEKILFVEKAGYKNVTDSGRPARKLFATVRDNPVSQKGLMHRAALKALKEYGVNEKSVQWLMLVGRSKSESRAIPDRFLAVVKYRSKLIGSAKYKNLYAVLILYPSSFDNPSSPYPIPSSYGAKMFMARSFNTLREAVGAAEKLSYPRGEFIPYIKASDIPENI